MSRTMVSAPKKARRGDIIEIKAMIQHKMETGHRVDAKGAPIPRDIINRFVCTYGGVAVFSAELFPAISANPFVAFSTVAVESGTLQFAWIDDRGNTETASAEIVVE
jgi:sulfur-oxidizing protein SoxZ